VSIIKVMALIMLLVFGGFSFVLFVRTLLNQERDLSAKGRHWVWFVAMMVEGVIFLLMWTGFNYADPPTFFLRALKDNDRASAYVLLSSELQSEFSSQADFELWSQSITPQSWFFSSTCSTFNYGRVDGHLRLETGTRVPVSFHMLRTEDRWLIQGVSIWTLGSDYLVGAPSGLDCSD